MERKDIFRTAVFGGYQKEDVADYIRSLENENETIRILTNKEKSDLKIQLEKEKATSEELKNSLAALQNKIAQLEQQHVQKAAPQNASEVPGHASEANPTQAEEWMQRLAEEQNAIKAGQKLLEENLAQMRRELQEQWQKGLEQLRFTRKDVQMQTGINPSVTEPPSESSVQPDSTHVKLNINPGQMETEPEKGAEPEAEQSEKIPVATSVMEKEISENNINQMKNRPEWSDSISEASPRYCQKADASIYRTHKRIEDLLQELDNF